MSCSAFFNGLKTFNFPSRPDLKIYDIGKEVSVYISVYLSDAERIGNILCVYLWPHSMYFSLAASPAAFLSEWISRLVTELKGS